MRDVLFGKWWRALAAVLLIIFTVCVPCNAAVGGVDSQNADNKIVYMLDLHGNCTKSAIGYVRRAILAAEHDNADYLLVKMDAFGRYNEDMKELSDLMLASPVVSVCYVEGKAYDGAALLALSCDTVVMSPGSCFGSEDKLSNKSFLRDESKGYWQDVLGNVAVATGRSVNAARSLMETENFGIYLTTEGGTAKVSADAAISVGLANYQATSIHVIFDDYRLSNGVIIQVEKSIPERLADVLANSVVSTMMLILTLLMLLLMVMMRGYGMVIVPAAFCFGLLYFVSVCQLCVVPDVESWLLPVALILILLEVWLSPGGWICGGVGFLCLFCSVVLFAPTLTLAAIQIILILIVAVIIIMTKTNNEKSKNILKKLVLRDRTTTENGYLSQPINIRDYVGMEGVALTALRPAGAVKIGSERVDVVTEGDFISVGDRVKVIKVDGSSVIVRKL